MLLADVVIGALDKEANNILLPLSTPEAVKLPVRFKLVNCGELFDVNPEDILSSCTTPLTVKSYSP